MTSLTPVNHIAPAETTTVKLESTFKYGPLPSINSLEFLPELFKTQMERNFNKNMTTTATATTMDNNDFMNSASATTIPSNNNNALLLTDMMANHQTNEKQHQAAFVVGDNEAAEAEVANICPVEKAEKATDQTTTAARVIDAKVDEPPRIRDVSKASNANNSLITNFTNVKVSNDKVNMETRLPLSNCCTNPANDEGSKLKLPQSAESEDFEESLPGTNMGVNAVGGNGSDDQNDNDHCHAGIASFKVRDEFVELKNQSGSSIMRAGDKQAAETSCRGHKRGADMVQQNHHQRQRHHPARHPQLHMKSSSKGCPNVGLKRVRGSSHDSSHASSPKNNCPDDNKGSMDEVGDVKEAAEEGVAESGLGVGGEVESKTKFPATSRHNAHLDPDNFNKIKV
uniref:Uncharacterized protein n=1 Tax=Stomoxys calcitrans TaxID=35570 RepID=A0A1I8Q055_STOCA